MATSLLGIEAVLGLSSTVGHDNFKRQSMATQVFWMVLEYQLTVSQAYSSASEICQSQMSRRCDMDVME